MKTQLIAFVICAFCLCGCRKKDADGVPTHVFSIVAFKSNDLASLPSASELVALKAFALSAYNPTSAPSAIDHNGLAKLGFSHLLTANQEVSMKGTLKQVCSQGLPWEGERKRLAVMLKPVQGGVEVYADSGPGGVALTPSTKNFVGFGTIGAHAFGDGLVIAWVLKPIVAKKIKGDKVRQSNPASRPVPIISPDYNPNPVFNARSRWQGCLC